LLEGNENVFRIFFSCSLFPFISKSASLQIASENELIGVKIKNRIVCPGTFSHKKLTGRERKNDCLETEKRLFSFEKEAHMMNGEIRFFSELKKSVSP